MLNEAIYSVGFLRKLNFQRPGGKNIRLGIKWNRTYALHMGNISTVFVIRVACLSDALKIRFVFFCPRIWYSVEKHRRKRHGAFGPCWMPHTGPMIKLRNTQWDILYPIIGWNWNQHDVCCIYSNPSVSYCTSFHSPAGSPCGQQWWTGAAYVGETMLCLYRPRIALFLVFVCYNPWHEFNRIAFLSYPSHLFFFLVAEFNLVRDKLDNDWAKRT